MMMRYLNKTRFEVANAPAPATRSDYRIQDIP